MKPIAQTTSGPEGNCFQACVASILELPLEQVPNFCQVYPGDWLKYLRRWLFQYDLCPVCVVVSPECQADAALPLAFLPQTHYILSGKSPRGKHLHAIVAYGEDLAHDPHESGDGLESVEDAIFFVPLYPERQTLTFDLGGSENSVIEGR